MAATLARGSMVLRVTSSVAAAIAAAFLAALPAVAAAPAKPAVTWLKGEGNYTKAHRSPRSIERIVVHVTEGSFWGSVQWLRKRRAHASAHYVVARSGRIIQLVHTSDIAWHAGNWKVNLESVGIEHEGFTRGPNGFTAAQYESSARLAAWIARRALLPIDRKHLIGHADVPAPGGGLGGASRHTDPGPRWDWDRYLRLVRRYAGVARLSVEPVVPEGPLRGIVSWRAKASPDIKRVEFIVDGRVVNVDSRPPFAYRLNTAALANRLYKLQVHGIAGPGRYDVEGAWARVDNKTFALTSAGARAGMPAPRTVRLRVRPWGQKAARMTFTVDGTLRSTDRRPPFLFSWSTAGAKPGRHVLEVVATSIDGRTATQRIPVVVLAPPKPKRTPRPVPPPPPPPPPTPTPPPLAIAGQSVSPGADVHGLVLWRVDATGRPERVEFLVDGVVRGADVAAPYTFGWQADTETAGPHVLTARAVGRDGRRAEASVTVRVAVPPASAGSAGP